MTAQPKTMTALYVTNTGHVLAVLTRTNPGGTPAAADVAGDGMLVRGLYTLPAATTAAPAPAPISFPDMFLVPAADLKTQDVPIDTTSAPALLNPRAFGLAVGSGASGAPPPPQPAFEPLGAFTTTVPTIVLTSTGALTLTFGPESAGKPYYAVVVSYEIDPQATPTVLNSFTGAVPSGGGAVALQTNTLVNPKYSVLLLVAAMRPVIGWGP
jgi:hypothetical protein